MPYRLSEGQEMSSRPRIVVRHAARRLTIMVAAGLLVVGLRSDSGSVALSTSRVVFEAVSRGEATPGQTTFEARVSGRTYPLLANYYLGVTGADRVSALARWDLLIISAGNLIRVERLWKIRDLNPGILLLAHINSHEVPKADRNEVMQALFSGVDAGWWVLEPGSVLARGVDAQDTRLVVEDGDRFEAGDDVQVGSEQVVVLRVEGDILVVERGRYGSSAVSHGAGTRVAAHVSKSQWPNTWIVNVDSPWSEYLADFMHERVMSTGLWDGIHYDSVFEGISWVNDGSIDLDRDGVRDDWREINERWSRGTVRLLERTRANEGDKLIIGNGRTMFYGPYLNGKLIEHFADRLGWLEDMENYWRTLAEYWSPQAVVINRHSDSEMDYRSMRFGLASALLGDGYYSFDFGGKNHSQTWWYDEYDVELGMPLGGAYQVGGIWRRDFEGGIVLVNPGSSAVEVDLGEAYRKIQGTQAPAINDGSLVTIVTIGSKDGLILVWEG